jgi:hypothetical protein
VSDSISVNSSLSDGDSDVAILREVLAEDRAEAASLAHRLNALWNALDAASPDDLIRGPLIERLAHELRTAAWYLNQIGHLPGEEVDTASSYGTRVPIDPDDIVGSVDRHIGRNQSAGNGPKR